MKSFSYCDVVFRFCDAVQPAFVYLFFSFFLTAPELRHLFNNTVFFIKVQVFILVHCLFFFLSFDFKFGNVQLYIYIKNEQCVILSLTFVILFKLAFYTDLFTLDLKESLPLYIVKEH